MKKVVIVGAGIAGISAAMNLADAGHEILVLESSNHIGGRMFSPEQDFCGWRIDNGQHVMMGAYHHFLDLLEKLNTSRLLKVISPLRVPFLSPDGKPDILQTNPALGKAGLLAGLFKMKGLALHSKLLLLIPLLRIMLNLKPSENATALNFLRASFQNKELIRRFWEPVIYATINSSPDKASAELLFSVMQKAFLGKESDSSLIIPSVPLSDLVEPFVDYLSERKGRVLLKTSVREMIFEGNKISALKTSDGQTLTADAFVFAIAPDSLFKLLPEEISKKSSFAGLAGYSYSPIISAYLALETELTPEYFLAVRDSDIQWIFNSGKLISKNDIPGKYLYTITISSAGKYEKFSHDEISDMILRELRRIFPSAEIPASTQTKIIFSKKATILIDPAAQQKRHKTTCEIENMFLAGDWTATGLPATLESAAMSGILSADRISKYFNEF